MQDWCTRLLPYEKIQQGLLWKATITSHKENTEYELKVETFTLARGQNFIEMFGLMLASFYIFNVEYPKKLEGSLMFLQKFLLGIGDETKTPQKVLQLMSKVKKAAI